MQGCLTDDLDPTGGQGDRRLQRVHSEKESSKMIMGFNKLCKAVCATDCMLLLIALLT